MKVVKMNIKGNIIKMIKRLLNYNLLCGVDTLVRTNVDDVKLLDCKECIY